MYVGLVDYVLDTLAEIERTLAKTQSPELNKVGTVPDVVLPICSSCPKLFAAWLRSAGFNVHRKLQISGNESKLYCFKHLGQQIDRMIFGLDGESRHCSTNIMWCVK